MKDLFSDREFWHGQDRRESLVWLMFAVGYGLLMGALHSPVTVPILSGNAITGFVVNPGFWAPLVLIPAIVETYRNDGALVGFALVGIPVVAMYVAAGIWLYPEVSIFRYLVAAWIISLVLACVAVTCGSGSRRFYTWAVHRA